MKCASCGETIDITNFPSISWAGKRYHMECIDLRPTPKPKTPKKPAPKP